jgi:hypothetical protein
MMHTKRAGLQYMQEIWQEANLKIDEVIDVSNLRVLDLVPRKLPVRRGPAVD